MNVPENQPQGILELELTYLPRFIPPEIAGIQPIVMEDTYIPEDPTIHAHLRVRRKDGSYEITKKLPVKDGDASAHIEHTIPLDEDEYAALRASSTRRIEKLRFKTEIDSHPAEVDVFQGRLAGLVLIDFEFATIEEKAAFTPPYSCLAEVTQQEFIAGGVLSGMTYDDIARRLGRLGYLRLEAEGNEPD